MNNPKTEEIVEALRRCATGEGDGCASCSILPQKNKKYGMIVGCAETLQLDAADRLEELEAELAAHRAQQRWIPVTERLPEDDDDVLIMSSGSISMGYYSTYNEYWADYINVYYNDVTHWMPLPEAPKE